MSETAIKRWGETVEADVDYLYRLRAACGLNPDGLQCERGYVRQGSKIVRFLCVTFYAECEIDLNPRTFFFVLDANDPRPMGKHFSGADCSFDWYASLPVGRWLEVA